MTNLKQSEAVPPNGNDLIILQSECEVTQFSDSAALSLLEKLMQADDTNPEPIRFDLRKTDDLIKAVVKFIQLNGFQAEWLYPSNYVTATIYGQPVRLKVVTQGTQVRKQPAHRQLQLQLYFDRVDGVDFVVQAFGEFVYWFYQNFGKGKGASHV